MVRGETRGNKRKLKHRKGDKSKYGSQLNVFSSSSSSRCCFCRDTFQQSIHPDISSFLVLFMLLLLFLPATVLARLVAVPNFPLERLLIILRLQSPPPLGVSLVGIECRGHRCRCRCRCSDCDCRGGRRKSNSPPVIIMSG